MKRCSRPRETFLHTICFLLAGAFCSALLAGPFVHGPYPAKTPVQNSQALPAGTILPVQLKDAISLKEAQSGQTIEGYLMQEIALPDRGKMAMKSLVKGTILAVKKDADGDGASLTVKFNRIEDRKQLLTVTTNLRAMAPYTAVRAAQMPLTGADGGTPTGWGTTVQIGGDIRFGDGGAVRDRAKQKVGKAVIGGVLAHVKANPAAGCEGPVNGDDRLQALWVFSADACGAYGLKGVKIEHTGKTPPLGEITLHFEKSDYKIENGAGLLLRVLAQP